MNKRQNNTNSKREISSSTIVIFGASGDLTERKLIPALHSLDCDELLPENVKVLGVARSEYSDEEFRQKLREGVQKHGRLKPNVWENFSDRLFYMSGSYDNPQTYQRLKERLDREGEAGENTLFYLAIPPAVYTPVIDQLGKSGLNKRAHGWSRIIIEKPFGRDLESARQLNQEVHAHFAEEQIYRIDHYLGKETVQNILAFRFANYIFESLWGRHYVDHVQITAVEDVGVGQRAGYYDSAGVVRDMIQNHLLQLVALTAMDPPAAMDAKSMRDEKVKVLQAVRPIELSDGVWGQYQDYRDEEGVEARSNTPTFAALKLYVDNWRWQGVPFYLRTGKSLATKVTEIVLVFKQVPHLIFAKNDDMSSNNLSICIQPDEGMHLSFELKLPGAEMRTSPVEMDFHYQDLFGERALPEAYERLLLDALQGDAALFARSDEIERAWELITPLLNKWESMQQPPLKFYEPGSWGPQEADSLLTEEGRNWFMFCEHE